jgi:hypothetical protein
MAVEYASKQPKIMIGGLTGMVPDYIVIDRVRGTGSEADYT